MSVQNHAADDCPPASPLLEELYRDEASAMLRLAWLMTGSRALAEDIVHDAFLRLEGALGEVQAPAAYLRRTVVNGVYARRRRAEVERRHLPAPPEPVFNPEVEETWAVVRALPVRQRQAIVLRYYDDASIEEIAALLACPEGTVKSLIHRALTRLRNEVER